MVGQSLEEQKQPVEVELDHYSVKEAVFPFAKFLGVDPVLGPEMRSTGEVMGVGRSFGEALFKSQLGADSAIPKSGRVFISVKEEDKPDISPDCQKVWDIFSFSGHTETNKSLCFPFPSAAVRSCPEGFLLYRKIQRSFL